MRASHANRVGLAEPLEQRDRGPLRTADEADERAQSGLRLPSDAPLVEQLREQCFEEGARLGDSEQGRPVLERRQRLVRDARQVLTEPTCARVDRRADLQDAEHYFVRTPSQMPPSSALGSKVEKPE